jgi:hypothetical protein
MRIIGFYCPEYRTRLRFSRRFTEIWEIASRSCIITKQFYPPVLAKKKDPAAVTLGRKGGREIAKRGSEYFRELQAKRKNRRGGRPPKPKKSRQKV